MIIDLIELEIKKVGSIELSITDNSIFHLDAAVDVFIDQISHLNKEAIGIICLDHNNKIINYSTVGIGNSFNVNVDYAQIFRVALLSNAYAIVIGHNHPDFTIQPSEQDIKVTKNIAFWCSNMKIKLIDSIIVTPDKKHYSIRMEQKNGN